MRPPILNRGLMFVALLLCSLTSHGPYVVMAGILLLCACCLSDPDVREALFSPRYVVFLSLSAAIITACYLWYLAVPHANTAYDLEKSANNNYLFFLLALMFLATFTALIEKRLDEITGLLSALLNLHCGVLFFQTATLLVTGQYIDFIKPITGEASRYLIDASMNPIFPFRPTGLYVEPSTYGAAVAAMSVGYILLSRARGRTPSLLPIALTVIAMLITQSTAAIVQAVVLIAAVMMTHADRTKASIAIAVFAIAAPSLVAAYFHSFLLKFNADSGLRFELISYIFQARHGWDYVFGYGPFSLEYDLYDLSKPRGNLGPAVASLNDAGLLNFFVVQFGVAGLAIPAAIFLRIRKDVGTLLFFGLLMTSKLSYTAPVLYLGLLPLILRLRPLPGVAARPKGADAIDVGRFEKASRAQLPLLEKSRARST
ncbi:hypothetical protein FAZ95_12960 [Trinickia violacea]|uniref:O-antigen ligase family protein n=1 Tax=Trinickia violacea TaxID=2571746 RepID=A0A4P8IPI1_9BURK|nr:hypothetical protein [Trinickia violacea]QCP50011.1 hypothetical protein FAZ95_12960 [Trinickia violacea]